MKYRGIGDFSNAGQLITPIYVDSSGFPAASAAKGSFAFDDTANEIYHSDGANWILLTPGGTISGSGTSNQLAYFTGTSAISSNGNGRFNGTNMALGSASLPASQRLTIVGETSDSTSYAIRSHNSGGSNDQFVVRNDGRVGILVSAPLYPLHVNGTTSIGDSVTASNSTRAVNLAATNAVMRILRISANSATAAPALELMHRTSSDGSNTVYYDIFGNSTGLSFRDRQNLADVKVLQIGLNGNATNRTVDAATSAVVTTQTYSLNSSGVAANGFGHRMLWQLESSTTNDQDAAAIDVSWSTATHASRAAEVIVRNVSNVTGTPTLTETFRYANDFKLIATGLTANTSTIQERILVRTNSTGAAAAGFGARMNFQLESSTTDNQDAGAFDVIWTTATHASRTSAVLVAGVNNAGALGEMARFAAATAPSLRIASSMGTAGTTQYLDNGITTGVLYTIGNSANQLYITSTNSSNDCIRIGSGTNANTGSLALGPGGSITIAAGNKPSFYVDTPFAPTSGNGTWSAFEVRGAINQTGGANGISRGIWLQNTITAASEYRALDITTDSSSAKGIYQSGANTTNYMVGKSAFGSTTAPTDMVTITGNNRVITGQQWSDRFALTDGATINTNWNNGNTQSVTLGGNRTMAAPTNPKNGARYTYIIRQDATGSRTLTWFTIKWAGGAAPVLTTTANKYDIITLIYDGTNYYGTAALNF